MRRNVSKTIIPAVILTSLLTGCWDKVELENRGFVNAIGIDKFVGAENDENAIKFEEEGTEKKRFTVSISLPSLEALSGKGTEDTKNKSVKLAANETVSAAMRLVDVGSSQKLYFGHTKTAVFGGGIMSDENLLRETVDALERNREIGRKMIVLATEGEAVDILKGDIQGEPLVGMFISNFYKNNKNAVALAFRCDLESLIEQLRTTNCAIIPKIELKEKEIKLGGAAVIKDFRLVGWLDDEETRGYLWVKGRAKGAVVTADLLDGYVPLRVNYAKPKLTFHEEEGRIVCNVKVNVTGDVEEYTFSNGALSDADITSKLSGQYQDIIANEIMDTFTQFQKKYAVDGFSLRNEIRKNNFDIYKKYENNWEAAFQKILLVPEIHVKIKSIGSIK